MASSSEKDAPPLPAGRFARWVFLLAGAVGIVEVVPLYFAEKMIGQRQPPAITHPEFFYGFLGVTTAWQVAFLIIARDPVRFRPLMPAAMIEKVLFPAAILALYFQARVSANSLGPALLDTLWLMLFAVAWAKTGSAEK